MELKDFTWLNTVLGNVKNALRGTYHKASPEHLPRYLAEFCYRFNRRFDLAAMLPRLGVAAVRTPPSCPTDCSSWLRLIGNQVGLSVRWQPCAAPLLTSNANSPPSSTISTTP